MSIGEEDIGPPISPERRAILGYIDSRIEAVARLSQKASPDRADGLTETAHRLRALRTDLRQCLDHWDEVAE